MTPRLIILASLAIFATVGCSFVEKTPEGQKARVLEPDEVETCRKLGKTKVSVLEKVIGIARPPETVAEELTTAGRNSAGDMGGDTIVAATEVVDGAQTFFVYKCVDPNAE
jgi:hypothetical protein